MSNINTTTVIREWQNFIEKQVNNLADVSWVNLVRQAVPFAGLSHWMTNYSAELARDRTNKINEINIYIDLVKQISTFLKGQSFSALDGGASLSMENIDKLAQGLLNLRKSI